MRGATCWVAPLFICVMAYSAAAIASSVAHDPGFVMNQTAKIPRIGDALESLRLLESGAKEIPGATADMLNFVNKTIGAGKKTVSTVWDGATGGGDD